MDMYSANNNSAMNQADHHKNAPKKHSLRSLISAHWGVALVGALIAVAIGVSSMNAGSVESRAMEVPEVAAETVSELPLN